MEDTTGLLLGLSNTRYILNRLSDEELSNVLRMDALHLLLYVVRQLVLRVGSNLSGFPLEWNSCILTNSTTVQSIDQYFKG